MLEPFGSLLNNSLISEKIKCSSMEKTFIYPAWDEHDSICNYFTHSAALKYNILITFQFLAGTKMVEM